MKTLQNNFTTPEQSNRLLELGVPADSADCCVENTWDGLMIYVFRGCETYSTIDKDEHPNIQYPCWSVGRLIEIFLLCTPYKDIALNTSNLVEQMVVSLFMVNKDGLLDFSKLED